MSDFTHLLDLASARLGGTVVAANDDFFGPKENLIKPEPPIFLPDKYTDRGKWMDGWETRRRRTPGHDWCIVKLGLPGIVHTVVVDTAFFKGNFPSHCSIDACGLGPDEDAASEGVAWHPLVGRTELSGNFQNTFAIRDTRRYTHVRLNIFPDGGVARLRVLGDVVPDWTRLLGGDRDLDLAAAVHGGYVVDASDRFFGEPRNMLMPYAPSTMADGWETKRRRGAGHDWAIVRLGIEGVVHRIEIDTTHFKGNYPDRASVDGAIVQEARGGVSADISTRAVADWRVVLPETKLEPDRLHAFTSEIAAAVPATHVRVSIYPDGGVSRFRVFGAPLAAARRDAVLRLLNILDTADARATLKDVCAAPSWIDRMMESRPFGSPPAVLTAADAAAAAVSEEEWGEAFRHHPRIGERRAERTSSHAAEEWSTREQAGVRGADPAELRALEDANRAYEDRFGHVFIVCASGRSAREILESISQRLSNDPATELKIAAAEQKKITKLRLASLLASE